ncbi:DNA-directed RNA polymerase subunit omega [Zhaonella formicivorans]|uniref:DNA-directed RNA polymerase subunit omega n=1 Tax=Zhaonella formicivorans TaxID=2528593 RepID=UPI0010D92DE7|nr:DNA-directed RNA polymerase subunit omega [Zhaonella formicivorans]
MNQPSIDELMKHVDSKYTLVVVAAKRARSFTGSLETTSAKSVKPVTRALEEIAQGKVSFERTKSGIK